MPPRHSPVRCPAWQVHWVEPTGTSRQMDATRITSSTSFTGEVYDGCYMVINSHMVTSNNYDINMGAAALSRLHLAALPVTMTAYMMTPTSPTINISRCICRVLLSERLVPLFVLVIFRSFAILYRCYTIFFSWLNVKVTTNVWHFPLWTYLVVRFCIRYWRCFGNCCLLTLSKLLGYWKCCCNPVGTDIGTYTSPWWGLAATKMV